ncbi:component of Pab1p-stimulated poly(A) ribonuclease [Scheffersomyces coipomensis]|uniref:component of Pab1p-stimulated poly(A) ribonuclease n=1 Tax=Scheffersomyces coipomensis TaxID=1788519 RepID=UPI00315DA072
MNINIDTAKDTLCKNILIYGYCKFENKGCAFNHNRSTPAAAGTGAAGGATGTAIAQPGQPLGQSQLQSPQQLNNATIDAKRKFNMNTPSFQPSGVQGLSNKFANLSPKLKDIPPFIPGGPNAPSNENDIIPIKKFNASTASFTPSFTPTSYTPELSNGQGQPIVNNANNSINNNNGINGVIQNPYLQQQQQPQQQQGIPSPSQQQQQQVQQQNIPLHNNSNDLYYQPPPQVQAQISPSALGHPQSQVQIPSQQQQAPGLMVPGPPPPPPPPPPPQAHNHNQATNYPLNYHLYAPGPPPRFNGNLAPYETNSSLLFIKNDLRESIQQKNEATLQTLSHSNLPDHISTYHSLVPIDRNYETLSKVWQLPSSIYKVYNNMDGNPYVLRRIEHHHPIINELPFKTIKKWKSIKNSNLVSIYDAFTTMSFGGKSSLILIYDFYPNSNTLIDHHKKNGLRSEIITEDILWNYLIQLINVLQVIHEKGLAARSSMDLNKIIVTNKNRIRLSSCGISDILDEDNYKEKEDGYEFDPEEYKTKLKQYQLEDIKNLGKILFELSLLTIPINLRYGNEFDQVIKHFKFSEEFIRVLRILNFDVTPQFSLIKFNEQYLIRTNKLFLILNNLQDSNDFVESQLSTELENSRLFRLLTKINFIIERPELNPEVNNNRYIIKLFRDFIFFQFDEFGKPIIELSRVLTNLNKLDAGIEEKLLLVSRDEKNCIIVSYKELRDIIDSLFRGITSQYYK